MATLTTERAMPGLSGGKRSSAHFEEEQEEEDDDDDDDEVAAAFCAPASGAPASSPKPKERKAARRVSPCPPEENGTDENIAVAKEDHEKPALTPFHACTHDLMVVALGFLADAEAPSELLEISKSSKLFRAAALDNIIWREMCEQKWKTKFGYHFRMDRAKKDAEESAGGDDSEFDLSVSLSSSHIRSYPPVTSDKIKCPEAGFWYHRYWNELKMSTVDCITLSDLREWQWSACTWFAFPDDDEPTVLQSGLWEANFNGMRFLDDGTVIGGELSPPYRIQGNGSIVNTTQDANKRCPAWTFRVRRLSNWGWELWSQCVVLRSYHKDDELEELWDDYQDELIYQDKEEGVPITREGLEVMTSRIVPRSMANKLGW